MNLAPAFTVFALLASPALLLGQICAVDADGTHLRRLAGVDGSVRSFAYSPDGSQIVFSAYFAASKQTRIYLMNSDGKSLRQIQVPAFAVDAGTPVFTPDGKQLLIYLQGPVSGLYLMNPDGSGARLFKGDAVNGVYSGDGSRIIFQRSLPFLTWYGPDLYISDADGSNEKQVPTPLEDSAKRTQFSFNPANSSEIVFTTWGEATIIWVQNIDGTNARPMTQPSMKIDGAHYTPDGKQIVYSEMLPGPPSQSAILIRDLTGRESQQLAVVPVTLLEAAIILPVISLPVVSPDGKTIACICNLPDPAAPKIEVQVVCAANSPSRSIILQGKDGPVTLTCIP